ncbi:hypothetical protein FPV67DRAFT_1559562 [Lyophyllum atratum]|nr:hypothetical protein FPV67DRAFT_1559562 [Lyophyllum atratum]
MDVECQICGALHWLSEKLSNSSDNNPTFGLCCNHGKVAIPRLEAPPEFLRSLYTSDTRDAKAFRDLIWKYNQAFALTSLGVEEDHSVNGGGRGPPVFRIMGELCHWSGALTPPDGRLPRYSQLYVYEPHAALDACMQQNGNLARDVMESLQELLLEHNQYAAVFKHVYEILQNYDTSHDVSVRLRVAPGNDRRRYNLPTADEVAIILPGNPTTESRDIILRHRDGPLHRVSELHPSYSPLQYPILFPRGENGWHSDMTERREDGQGDKRLSLTRYCAFRIQVRRDEISTILRAGRLFSPADQNRLRYIIFNQPRLRASLYSGLEDAILNGDENIDLNELGQRVILPSSDLSL